MFLSAYIFGLLWYFISAGPVKEKVHVKIHIPHHVHKHHHTKTVYLHKKPKYIAFPPYAHNYQYHSQYRTSNVSPYRAITKVNKHAHIKLKKPHRDLALAKLIAKQLLNTQNKNKKLLVIHHHSYAPLHSGVLPHATLQNNFLKNNDNAEIINPQHKNKDLSYVIGSGYQVEEFHPYDPTPTPYSAFYKDVDTSNENEPNSYMHPEKITEYISFIQKGFTKEHDADFGSDHADEFDKFSKGEFDEANEHAGSEFHKSKEHMTESQHEDSKYKNDYNESKIV